MSYATATRPATNGLAVVALVLSLIAFLGAWIPILNIASILLGVAGAIFALTGIARWRKNGSGFATALAGLIISVAAIVISILVLVAASAAVTAIDDSITDFENDPSMLEYDLDADPMKLYPNGIYGDVDQSGGLEDAETYATKGSAGWLKDDDLDGNGKVSYYESEKHWYDLSNTDF